jgi:hypothetical protein
MGFSFSGRTQTAPINSEVRFMDYTKIWDLLWKKWWAKRWRRSWRTEKCRSDGTRARSHHQVFASQRSETRGCRCGTVQSVPPRCVSEIEQKILDAPTRAGEKRHHDRTCWRETASRRYRHWNPIGPSDISVFLGANNCRSPGLPASTVYWHLVEKIGFKN